MPGKNLNYVSLGTFSKNINDKKIIRNSKPGFTRGQILLDQNNYILQRNDWLWRRREQSMLHLVFSQPFDTLSHSILNCKLKKYCLEKWTFQWAKSWLNCWAPRAGINDSMSSWHPAASKICSGTRVCIIQYLHQRPGQWDRVQSVYFWLVLIWGGGWQQIA